MTRENLFSDGIHTLFKGLKNLHPTLHISWPIWLKLGTENLCKYEFRGDGCSGTHTLNVNRKFQHFRPICTQFSTDDVYTNELADWEFRENQRCESHALLRRTSEFLCILRMFIGDLGEIWYRWATRNVAQWAVSWQSRREGRRYLTDSGEITFTRYHKTVRHFEGNERLGNVRVLLRGTQSALLLQFD